MDKKPKNLSDAIDQLEQATDGHGTDFRERLERELAKFEGVVNDLKAKAGDEFHVNKEKIETEVKKHPWAALGIVALFAFILGLIFSPRGSRRSD